MLGFGQFFVKIRGLAVLRKGILHQPRSGGGRQARSTTGISRNAGEVKRPHDSRKTITFFKTIGISHKKVVKILDVPLIPKS